MIKQAGEGKLGCLVTLVLLITFAFICFRVVPVILDKMDFEDQLERLASEAGARNWDPDVVRTQIEQLAKNKEFQTSPETMEVRHVSGVGRGDLRITLDYWRSVDFMGYVHTFRFHSEVKSFVGTL